MQIRCPVHGAREGIFSSRDVRIEPGSPATVAAAEIVELLYMYVGKVALAFYLSRAFAEKHGLTAGVKMLPGEEPGAWSHQTVGCCASCFTAAYGGAIDETGRWKKAL